MNPRIKELVKQAGLVQTKWADADTERVRICQESLNNPGSLEKFAEQLSKLVVEECIRYFNEDYQRDFDVLWHDDLSAKLSDHFKLGTNLV